MSDVCLIIIYNHQYNKNIEILERIYERRFSNIYHLVPFYIGDKINVIPVYENSHYFQGYISQGYKSFFDKNYKHYFFVADDMVLNPAINENNYEALLKLNTNTCFISGFKNLHKTGKWWKWVGHAYNWNINVPGVEAKNQLPDYEEALQLFNKFGLDIEPLHVDQILRKKEFPKYYSYRHFEAYFSSQFKHYRNRNKKYKLTYPLVGAYSDIFVVSANTVKQFCHYCGVFSATKLFVEIAIPTALVLSAQEIVNENDLKLKGRALWGKKEHKELDIYKKSLKQLLTNFPKDYLYLHPVKLSKWNTSQ
jgi:hypothetical protein